MHHELVTRSGLVAAITVKHSIMGEYMRNLEEWVLEKRNQKIRDYPMIEQHIEFELWHWKTTDSVNYSQIAKEASLRTRQSYFILFLEILAREEHNK